LQKTVSLKKIVNPLKIVTIQQVQAQCPIESGIFEDFNFKHCLDCPFVVVTKGKKGGSCGWYEYATEIVEERSEIEPDDPITDYYRTIQCANCGSEIQFYSSYSVFARGVDKEECPKCGLLHAFLRHEKGSKEIFAISIKQWDEKHPPKQSAN